MQYIAWLVFIFFVSTSVYWFFVHIKFWRVLKLEAPETYKKYSGYSIKATGGFLWIDYALSRGYKKLKNKKVTDAGDALCKAYLGFISSFSYLISLASIVFLLSVVWFLINKNI